MALPQFEPMLATTGALAASGLWVVEPKLDGWRALVYVGRPMRPHSARSDRHRVGATVGQRFTTLRRTLVDLLADARQPLSIPDILNLEPTLAQSSVYRNLAVLEEVGVVRRVVTTDDFARHELAEDLTEHHHHLICSACGVVEDFTASPHVERSVARAISEVSSLTGFTSEHHRLDLIGVCSACA